MNILNKIQNIKTQTELNEFKNTINEAIDERAKFIALCEFANNSSIKSFGYIKENFENISSTLFNTEGGKKILNKYTKTIKESNNLSALHLLYENVRKMGSNADIQFFINNITENNWNVDKKTLNEDVKTLGRVLAEGILKIGDESYNLINQVENVKLNKAVEFIAENKKTNKNLAKYSEAVNIIREHVNTQPNTSFFDITNIDEYANSLLEAFNKKYTSDLSEDDWKILEAINKREDKEVLFNEFKSNCINKLTEAENRFKESGDIEDSKKVSAVLEKINKKTYVFENITADICGFAEISKIFE